MRPPTLGSELRFTARLHRPTSDPRILAAGVGDAAERLAARLRRDGRVAGRLRLLISLADGTAAAADQRLNPALADEPRLFRTARALLARLLAQPRAVRTVTLVLDRLTPAAPDLPLFEHAGIRMNPAPSPDPTVVARVTALRAKFADARRAV